MPKIRLKRGVNITNLNHKLSAGEPAFDTNEKKLYIGNTDNDGGTGIDDAGVGVEYAEKIGNPTNHPQVGETNRPVYVNSFGVITPITFSSTSGKKLLKVENGSLSESGEGVGSGKTPVYMESGEIKASSETVGSDSKPVYLNGGEITAFSSAIGGGDEPIYYDADDGFTPGKKYAGGTLVNLNGNNRSSKNATIYAPTSSGTEKGQILLSKMGIGDAPSWLASGTEGYVLMSDGANKPPVWSPTAKAIDIEQSNPTEVNSSSGIFVATVLARTTSTSGYYRIPFVVPFDGSSDGYASTQKQSFVDGSYVWIIGLVCTREGNSKFSLAANFEKRFNNNYQLVADSTIYDLHIESVYKIASF